MRTLRGNNVLVLFLDDLQWALPKHKGTQRHFVGRRNQSPLPHWRLSRQRGGRHDPLSLALHDIRESGGKVRICVAPLG